MTTAATRIDATCKVVSPGFVNMLSWAIHSLIEDPRAMSDLRQGVTLEVFGEGWAMGPWTEAMKAEEKARQGDIQFDIAWTTLGEYLDWLTARGVAPNVASFVGATTVRIHEIGYENRAATPEELARMQDLVREAMREGALGVGSSLIYAPANWHKLERVFEMVEDARREGLRISANMYAYAASATGLNASMPLWVQEGGHAAWMRRLRDPQIRARVVREMTDPDVPWENRFVQAGPEKILLLSFRNDDLKPLTGRTLAQVAAERGTAPAETAIDLVLEDDSRVGVAYFMMNEDNVRRKVRQPWVSFGSDAGAPAAEGVFLESSPHPRAYGNFARVLGRYSRDEGLVPLEEAIRRMTSLPADNIGARGRGRLRVGAFADVVVFDPTTIIDNATFADPHRYATGVTHVLVNGVPVLAHGEPTGATPGRVVRGPGWSGGADAAR